MMDDVRRPRSPGTPGSPGSQQSGADDLLDLVENSDSLTSSGTQLPSPPSFLRLIMSHR